MSTLPKTYFTPEEYLQIERKASFKSQFYRGEMFAMAGASQRHNLLVSNLVTSINTLLRETSCQVYPSDMRVKVSQTGLYTYPDVVVVCERPQFDDTQNDTLLNPRVLVEVLSESTEAYDRGPKFEQYRRLESLQEYILVAQDRRYVELYQRQPNNHWLLSEFQSPADAIPVTSVAVTLHLSDIYFKVDFESSPPIAKQ